MIYTDRTTYIPVSQYQQSTLQTEALTAASSTENTVDFATVLNTSCESRNQTSLDAIFKQAAATYNVSEDLLKAVAKQESNFQTDVVSSAGATGVMQLMPSTAKAMGVEDSLDPTQNIMGGAKLLSQLLNQYNGDTALALAAYNAGTGNVAKYGGIPPFKETQNYVAKVLGYLETGVTVPNTTVTTTTNTTTTTTTNTNTTVISPSVLGIGQAFHSNTNTASGSSSVFPYSLYMKFLDMYADITSSLYEDNQGGDR